MKTIKKNITVLKDKGAVIEKEIRERTLGYVVASFSLVAGLAWNDAIKAAIEEFFPLNKDGIKAKFLYAAAITAVVVIISMYLSRIFKREKKEEPISTTVKKVGIKNTKDQSTEETAEKKEEVPLDDSQTPQEKK